MGLSFCDSVVCFSSRLLFIDLFIILLSSFLFLL
jgi:hypothetical protein